MSATEAELFLAPQLPPLLQGRGVGRGIDPFFKAIAAAEGGEEAGLVTYAEDDARLRLAVLLAPDRPLAEALGASFAVSLGLADALGALGPPELAVHFVWPKAILVNRGEAGRLRLAAATADPAEIPEWMVFGLDVSISSQSEDPGLTPERTTLEDEGCVGIPVPTLLESWSRHFLVWLNRFMSDGLKPLHGAWCAKCMEIGKPLETLPEGMEWQEGGPAPLFLGLDDEGGMILRRGEDTILLPLHDQLDFPR